jgi:hypothetical protein
MVMHGVAKRSAADQAPHPMTIRAPRPSATAWLLKHKLMEVMRLREDGRQLTGVEIDDAYLGGGSRAARPAAARPTRCPS